MNRLSLLARALLILGIALVVSLALFRMVGGRQGGDVSHADSEDVADLTAGNSKPQEVSPEEALKAAQAPASGRSTARSTASVVAVSTPTEINAQVRELMARLLEVASIKGPITPEQAENWKLAFADLVNQGTAAVPGIREFLEKNSDVDFRTLRGGILLGQPSMRTALIKALQQIGGSEAQDLMVQTMGATAVPSEIALLANYLEQQAPGQYRKQALSAAGDVFTMASQGQLPGLDVGPLIQMVRNFDAATVKPVAEKLEAQYGFYAAMALAGAEGGAGLSSMLNWIDSSAADASQAPDFAYQMLAQVATQSPDASAALLQRARSGKISDSAWAKIAVGLAGDQYCMFAFTPDGQPEVPSSPGLKTYHMESGNQNFYSLPVSAIASPEQVALRRNLIDQLLATKPNPAVVQALQEARAGLSAGLATK